MSVEKDLLSVLSLNRSRKSQRWMLPYYYHLNEQRSYDRVNRLTNEKAISKSKCISMMESIVSNTEFDLDVMCFSIHNIDKEILKLVKKGAKVRIIFRQQSRKKLQSFANKLIKHGAMVRWMPASQPLFCNLFLRDMNAGKQKPPLLLASPLVLVSMHDSAQTKIASDVMSALFYTYERGKQYHLQFEDMWKKLGPRDNSV